MKRIEIPLTPVRTEAHFTRIGLEIPLTPTESEKMTWEEALKRGIMYSFVATEAILKS